MFFTKANNYTCNHHTVHVTPKEWWESISSLQFHSSHAHHVFNEIAVFSANVPHMISQPTDQFLPTLLPPPARYYWKSSSDVNVRWERSECWWFFSSSAHLFFNEIAIFSANAPHMILQPTEWFLPRCFCRPLTIIKKQQWHKKNGEKEVSVDYFSVLPLTFFQWNCYF